MYGTEFARISGSYSTAYITTYEVIEQSVINNSTKFKLRGYFYYGGGTSVGSATGNGFYLDGNYIASGNYRYYPGYTLLGEIEITVGHNNDGSFPGRYVGISASSYHMNGTTGGNLSAPKINRLATITKANDFNDEQNPYMEFTNPANFKVNLVLEFAGTSIRRDGITGSGGYTFELTESERKLLRQKCTANTLTVRYVVATLVDGTNESLWDWTKPDKTMTLINANPEFSNFTFKDINETTVALTGNDQNIIKGASNVEVTIPVANKAVAKKETTMNKYRFTCGDKADDQSYSDTADVNLTINGVSNGTFTVYATDKRDNSTPVTKLANQVINYSPLTKISIDAYRSGGVSEEVILQLEGTINVVNFGKVTNSIKTAKVKYRVAKTSEWSTEQDITLEVVDGKFSYNGAITGDLESKGFNISNSYEVEVIVTDELSSVTFTDTFGSGVPNIAYHKNGISVMGKYDVDEGGLFQVAGKNVLAKDAITLRTARHTQSFTAWVGQKITNMSVFRQVGNKLSMYDNGVKIGKGVSKVLASASMSCIQTDSDMSVQIHKGGDAYVNSYGKAGYYWNDFTTATVLIDVKEGDVIHMVAAGGATKDIEILGPSETILTVVVIE